MKGIDYIEIELGIGYRNKTNNGITFNKILSELLLMIPYKDYPINHFINILNSIDIYESGNINITIINLNRIEISIYFDNLLNKNFRLKNINKITQSYEYRLYIIKNSHTISLSCALSIELKDKIKLAQLRRFILDKLKNKTIHKYLERVFYSNKFKIYITESNFIVINYNYKYDTNNNYINFTCEAIPFYQDKKLKELFSKSFETKKFFNVKFNKIHEVIKNYFKSNENTPFKLLRKAINLKNIYFLL